MDKLKIKQDGKVGSKILDKIPTGQEDDDTETPSRTFHTSHLDPQADK